MKKTMAKSVQAMKHHQKFSYYTAYAFQEII